MSRSPEALFEAIAARREQVVLQEGVRVLTGAALMREVDARVALLERFECRRIAIALDNGLAWALWDLAILKAGRIGVPLPAFFSPEQLRHVLDSAGVDSLIGDDIEPWLEHGFVQVEAGLSRRSVANVVALPRGTAKITYTSGTTGRPRGVCLSAETMLAVAGSLVQAGAACEVRRHLTALPLAVLLENIGGLYAPLLAGAEVILAPASETGFHGASLDAARFLGALARHRPHSLILMPQLLQVLVEAGERGVPLPGSLRFVAVGGARVAPELLRRADALGVPVFEGYGLSECASVVCLNTPAARCMGTVGRPLPHCDLRLSERDEVMVRGPHMLGYVGEPPFADEWLATGDLGHFEDGYLVLHGRRKHQFATAWGRNVNPEWVEAELVQCAPIAQAWLYGEALTHNVAVLVPRAPDTRDAALAAAVAAANRRLPNYLRAHRWMRADAPFTAANGLATANGRLRRDALVARYLPAIEGLLDGDVVPTHLQGEPA